MSIRGLTPAATRKRDDVTEGFRVVLRALISFHGLQDAHHNGEDDDLARRANCE